MLEGLALEKREPLPNMEGEGFEKMLPLVSVFFVPKSEPVAGAIFAGYLEALSTVRSFLGGAGWPEKMLLNSPTP